MKEILKSVIIPLVLGFTANTYAASQSDIISTDDSANGLFFVQDDANKKDDPYYRGAGEDWGWTHSALNSGFTTASLNISAYDVDASCGSSSCEVDTIQLWNSDASTWENIGNLAGSTNSWSFTNFSLNSSWFDEIAAGLQVRMLIDELNSGWLVALSKSSLEVDGGSIGNPNPGGEVPIPAAVFMFLPALLGFLGFRRKLQA